MKVRTITSDAHLTPPAAMSLAAELALNGPAWGSNPRVGCVLTDSEGTELGRGWHRGAGTPHAEVAALEDARAHGRDVAGATAYVTLEPCRHTGRTGPCAEALLAAGVGAVRYAVADPGAQEGGGAEVLASGGVNVALQPDTEATELTRRWRRSVELGRPYVILKTATTLDGRTAAADGSSFWITGEESREHAHTVRAEIGALIVGTETVAVDDPELSARGEGDPHQPLRVVIGTSDVGTAKVFRDDNAIQCATHDPAEVLRELAAREIRVALVEGGARVRAAFLREGLVDEVHAYVAPALLGAGLPAVADFGIATIGDALRLEAVSSLRLGADTLITGVVGSDSVTSWR